ncbi:NUDIX hydrolase [Flavobacterium rhizosphaerae]|uniref:CoA pyrophosphatase n=1 Tax=Flavobacterium rhizosphaerae TaxID=3163298 RepID=A0ABW8Z276_9FLAO
MLFTEFIKLTPKIVNSSLPAVTAHIKMAPIERQAQLGTDYFLKNNPRESAVMMLFYPKNDQATLVLTKRNTYKGVHSAQISFPGGKKEPEDNSLTQTALRETYEEIGIAPSQINVIMPFTKVYIPPSNFLVVPFLGTMGHTPVFVPDPKEVNTIIEMPVQTLLDDAIVTTIEMKTSYAEKIVVPAFEIEGNIIWGATAMMLSELKEIIKNTAK